MRYDIPMSLDVYAYVRTETGGMEDIDDSLPSSAGFEKCRKELWGSKAARSLRLKVLPRLAHSDVYAETTIMLDNLEADLRTVLANLDFLAERTPYGADYIKERTSNILGAVECAQKYSAGCVVIW